MMRFDMASPKPVPPFAGVSLSMASGACASTSEATANTPPTSQPRELFLGEEEIFDTSLSTFYTFDKENGGAQPLAQHLRFARGGCGGCGGCGCGGCGICWTWPWVGWCWGESNPPTKVASVASEQSAQTAEVAVKGGREYGRQN
jgi:hypothetical protein